MVNFDCPRKCCNAKYCPPITSWATTIHKFQGFEAGFETTDNIKRIIADISTLDWEKINPGTAYVVASRAKTIGKHSSDNKYPIDSNLFFTGTIGAHRFTRCRYKNNGEECLLIQKRDLWIQYLETKIQATKNRRSTDDINSVKAFILDHIQNEIIRDKHDLQRRIVRILRNPNDEWRLERENYRL